LVLSGIQDCHAFIVHFSKIVEDRSNHQTIYVLFG